MASPLTTALKPNVSAGDETEQKYQEALSQLMERLDTRKNRMFDPTLLAAAQGFLTPGQTGSFGEALGNVAQKVGAAQQQQGKEDIDLAQMRLQVAQGAREQAGRLKGQEAFRGLLGGQGAVGAPGAEPPAGQAPKARSITMEDALRYAAAFPEQKEMAKLLVDAVKFNSDRFKPMQNGSIFDTVTERFLDIPIPGQTASEYYIPELGESRTLKMTPSQYSKYQEARAAGVGRDWVADFTSPTGGKKATPASELPPPKSESERAAQAAAATELATKGATSEAQRTNAVMEAGRAARGLVPIYDSMLTSVRKPGMEKVMGVLERGDIQSAIGSLIEEAFRVGNFSIGVPAIRKVLAQSNVDQKIIDEAAQLGQMMAMTQFQQRQGLGSGTSVSNFEQQMVNAMGPSFADTVSSFEKKVRFMRESDQFKIELAKAIKQKNTTYDKFEDTKEFEQMFDAYRKRVEGIVRGGGMPSAQQRPAAPGAAPRPANPAANPAANRLRQELGIQ